MQSAQKILQKQKSEHMSEHMGLQSNQHMVRTYEYNEYDNVVDDYKHLRLDDSFRKLHIFHAKRIGISKYIQLAKTAEQEGNNPARYFTWLLKNENKSY